MEGRKQLPQYGGQDLFDWFDYLEPRILLSSAQHVVLIDQGLTDYQTLALAAGSSNHVITYNSEYETAKSLLEQVTTFAIKFDKQIQSLSILSHGQAGDFSLGNAWITANNLSYTADAWQNLSEAMTDDAGINIFSCNVASDTGGQTLLDKLSALSGADVYGSNDLTGAGGDWILEVSSNSTNNEQQVDGQQMFDGITLASYQATLANVTPTIAAAPPPGTAILSVIE